MSKSVAESPVDFPKAGEPAWRIALFYPEQGEWTESDYLNLDGGPLVELESGFGFESIVSSFQSQVDPIIARRSPIESSGLTTSN